VADFLYPFPYREEGLPPHPRPTLDVRLLYGETGDWSCRALVDTGAPITVFDRPTADALTIRIGNAGARTGRIKMFGSDWPCQFEYVEMNSVRYPELSWSANVAFVSDYGLQMPFQGVLGTEGFLDKYAVTFNKCFDYFVVHRADEWHDRFGQRLLAPPYEPIDLDD